ncbi:MAG: ABC transporter permease subunit [Clostridia bacterium]|nr:ABC transporter permease subunit [Clostridia bacterium]
MNSYSITLSLFKKELKNIFKYPFTYVFILLLAIIIWDTSTQVFQKFYETKEAYEENLLGYITYEEFQSMSEEEFLKEYRINNRINKGEPIARVYEDYMSNEERGKLFLLRPIIGTNKKFEDLYEEYCRSNKIIDYGFMNYDEIKLLSKEQYEKICHSLYVPRCSKNFIYFSNGILRYYPTYEQAKELVRLENLSSVIAREYYFRIMQFSAIIGTLLIISYLVRDYKNNVITNIKSSNIRSYQYIVSKYLALTIVILSIYFILTMSTVFIFKSQYNNLSWQFQMVDFIKYFVLLPFVTQSFLNGLAMLITVISKDLIFSTAAMFYYIFIFGQSTKFADGTSEWVIKNWKYFPRTVNRLGIMETQGNTMVVHQIGYFIVAICIVLLTIYIWQRNRIERSC